MHHPHPAFDEAFLVQISAQLSKQRDELDRHRRAKVASTTPEEKIKSAGRRSQLRLGDFPGTTGSSLRRP
jgi:hypothetical protein